MYDKLFCHTAGISAITKTPCIGLGQKFLLAQCDIRILSCQSQNNGIKFFFLRTAEVNADSESGYQRQFFLHGIGTVQFILRHIRAVTPCLPDQMTAVGGRIDRNVSGPASHAAFEDGLEGCEVVVVGGEAQVVDEEDELAQAEWLKVYGAIFGCEDKAEEIYAELTK